MKSVYKRAAARFPAMRREVRARMRDQREAELGLDALFSHSELAADTQLAASETYQHMPPTRPFGQENA
jgi:hypothetical protein